MKKIIVLLFCLSAICASNVFAQKKGDMYVGGTVGFGLTTYTSEEVKLSDFTGIITPEYSYFVADNFRIGAELSFNLADNGAIFNLSPSFAYYLELVDNFYFTPEITIGGGLIAGKNLALGAFSLGINLVGFELRPTKHVGISLNMINIPIYFLHLLAARSLRFRYRPTLRIYHFHKDQFLY